MTEIIRNKIKEKLAFKDNVKKMAVFNGIFTRLGNEKYRPQKGDAIRNHLSEFKTVVEKRIAYNRALDNNDVAWIDFDTNVLLGTTGAEFNDVEFIGGLWRVQRPFNKQIIRVRNLDFVINEKLPQQEHTKFDFFKAYRVNTNCYGNYIFENKNGYDCIVARYDTNKGVMMECGQTLEQARAFLGLRLYYERCY